MPSLIGIDLGTTSIKAVLYDAEDGRIIASAVRGTPVQHPLEGWREHDPEEVWQAAADCIRELTGSNSAAGMPVAGLAISSMAETGVLMDENYQPLAPMIAWYDRRSEPQAAAIESQISIPTLYAITGQRVNPSFGATKILWTKENAPEIFRQARRWLPIPAFLLQRLTGQAAVDYTIAARTLLFDQRRLEWSDTLLGAFGIDPQLMPPAAWAGTAIGYVTALAAAETGLSTQTICVLGGHDHLCAGLAAGGRGTGAVIDSTGTANALLMLQPNFLPDPSLPARNFACYTYVLPDLYVLKGGLKASGSAIEWLARRLAGGGEPDYAGLEEKAWAGAGKQAGPIWLPHLNGSGTPEGDRFSRAALVGAQFEHEPHDLFRGMLESLAFWTRQNLEEMQSITEVAVKSLTLTGGVTRLRLLSQLKADVINLPAVVPTVPEAAATGAALLAGLGCGVFSSPAEAVASLRYANQVIEPDPRRADWYNTLYQEAYRPLYRALQPIHAAMQRMMGGSFPT